MAQLRMGQTASMNPDDSWLLRELVRRANEHPQPPDSERNEVIDRILDEIACQTPNDSLGDVDRDASKTREQLRTDAIAEACGTRLGMFRKFICILRGINSRAAAISGQIRDRAPISLPQAMLSRANTCKH
jgi:hypothetical protein